VLRYKWEANAAYAKHAAAWRAQSELFFRLLLKNTVCSSQLAVYANFLRVVSYFKRAPNKISLTFFSEFLNCCEFKCQKCYHDSKVLSWSSCTDRDDTVPQHVVHSRSAFQLTGCFCHLFWHKFWLSFTCVCFFVLTFLVAPDLRKQPYARAKNCTPIFSLS
jgi:hypothetical protein